MKPHIDSTQFGSITIAGETYTHDVVVRLGGREKKRKKKLSKARYGTSHTISIEEAKHVHEDGASRLIVGAGQDGCVKLSDQASHFLRKKGCSVDLLPTPQALVAWNSATGQVIGMFHVTC